MTYIKGRTPWNKGKKGYKTKPCSEERKQRISNALKGNRICVGRKHTEETKLKISKANKIKSTGRKQSEETVKKRSESMKGKNTYKRSKETRLRMSIIKRGIKLPDEHRNKISRSMKGHIHSEETKQKLSTKMIGDKNPMYGKYGDSHHNWNGGTSFEPYCHKFNRKLKEGIRNRDDRTCQLCGIKENGVLLSVHHIHYDRENCTPDLIALCRSCNNKVNFNRDYWESFFITKLKERGIIK